MKLLSNPILVRMAVMFIAAGFAFVLGLLVIKRMRRSITEEASFGASFVSGFDGPFGLIIPPSSSCFCCGPLASFSILLIKSWAIPTDSRLLCMSAGLARL